MTLSRKEKREISTWAETVLVLAPEAHHVCAGRCATGSEAEAQARLEPWHVSFGPEFAGAKAGGAEDHLLQVILVTHGSRKTDVAAFEPPGDEIRQVLFIAHGEPGG